MFIAPHTRSLLVPPKAVLLNVISVGAAWGVITLVWQQGHGSDALWGISATHSVDAWIPLMVLAFLFGPSMDYEVFILARMRSPASPSWAHSCSSPHENEEPRSEASLNLRLREKGRYGRPISRTRAATAASCRRR